MDVLTLPFYNAVFCNEAQSRPGSTSIELAPVVQHRTVLNGHKLTMWAEYDDAVCTCETGDVVRFACTDYPAGEDSDSISSLWVRGTRQSRVSSATEILVQGSVQFMWAVQEDSCAPQEARLQNVSLRLSPAELSVLRVLRARTPLPISSDSTDTPANPVTLKKRKQTTIHEFTHPGELKLYPGDICALIRPDCNTSTTHTCIFVASIAGHATGARAERLTWNTTAGTEDKPYIRVFSDATVRGIPTWMNGRRSRPTFPHRPVRNRGKLKSGKPYLVYRIALYGDGFSQHKSLSDRRSVDGCYMVPLGLPAEERRSSCATRIISLAPHGHKTNEILNVIQKDLVDGARNGIEGIDPYGRSVQIFLDTVGIFGDYPALTALTDVRGHNGTAFYTFCTFREVRNSRAGSRLYSTAMHSRRLGGMRTDLRRNIIRPILNDTSAQQLIGYSRFTRETTHRLPLVRLARDLSCESGSTLDEHGALVVPAGFDSVQSKAAAPDHLITGLIEDTMMVCFKELNDNSERRRFELRIMHDATSNGISTEGKFLRWDKEKCEGLRSMSMSSRLSVLLSAVPPFDEKFKSTTRSVFLLPRILQRFVSSVYFYPKFECDGPDAIDAFNPARVLARQGEQHRAAREHIEAAFAIHREKAPAGKCLSKPNAHRAIELCVHTITNFGHARNCSEMILEMTHRRFKNWLEVNSHAAAHISSVERAIASAWQSRVSSLYRIWTVGTQTERNCAALGLCRLLHRPESLHIDLKSRPGQEFIEDFNTALRDAFRDPIVPEMELCGQINSPCDRQYVWEAHRQKITCREDSTMTAALDILEDWYKVQRPGEDVDLSWHTTASFMPVYKFGARRRTYPHHMVSTGCAVSVVAKASDEQRPMIFDISDEDEVELKYYAVYGVLLSSTGDVWSAVRQLLPVHGKYSVDGGRSAVLRMTNNVRRVAAYHVCDKGCTADINRMHFKHSQSLLCGGMYTLVRRIGGYPPHLG